jgi:hypothetical protein
MFITVASSTRPLSFKGLVSATLYIVDRIRLLAAPIRSVGKSDVVKTSQIANLALIRLVQRIELIKPTRSRTLHQSVQVKKERPGQNLLDCLQLCVYLDTFCSLAVFVLVLATP